MSNGDGIVNVYRYWQHVLVGELTDFNSPKGECSDGQGNVYITDSGDDQIDEYAHGGTSELRAIDESPYEPYACAVDPKTGDLAVANDNGGGYYSQGNVAIYKHASGKPVFYSNKELYNVLACGYDRYGDLLVTGTYSDYYGYYLYTEFGYMPAKSRNLEILDVPPPSGTSWPPVEGVQWDGKLWTIVSGSTLYQYTIDIKPVKVGSVALTGNGDQVAFYNSDPKKQATEVVGGYGFESKAVVNYWRYPSGGSPIASLTHGVYEPFGFAISVGQ